MNSYIYPQNLKSSAMLWFWNLKDIAVLGIALLISILALSQIRLFLPLALTLLYGFLTIRLDDISVLDFIKRAFRFFVSAQQYFEWKVGYSNHAMGTTPNLHTRSIIIKKANICD